MNKKVIVLGSDHYNAIGVVQCLGQEGVYIILVLSGKSKHPLISRSKYVRELYQTDNYEDGIDLIVSKLVQDEPTVIIPCGDEAALLLENNRQRLKDHFLFQHVIGDYSLADLMNKNLQARLASESGLDAPVSYEVTDLQLLPLNIPYPCIVKPLLSCEGDKRDITVAYTEEELYSILESILKHTPRVIVQQYIQSKDTEKELNILGCSLTDGRCVVPMCIEKVRVHPKGTGSVSVGKVFPLTEEYLLLKEKICTLIKNIGYVGLFSVELIVCNDQKNYFIELNLRNDALNMILVKAGVNLPYIHLQDLIGEPLKDYQPINKSMTIICEPIHMASLYHRGISLIQWTKDIIHTDGFMLYDKNDKGVVIHHFIDKLRGLIIK